jgi:hypothetical protein
MLALGAQDKLVLRIIWLAKSTHTLIYIPVDLGAQDKPAI